MNLRMTDIVLMIVFLIAGLKGVAQTDQSLEYASYFGGNDWDYSSAMDFDEEGNYVIAGATESNTLIPAGNGYQPFNNGGYDGLIALFSDDHDLQWATYFGGEGYDVIHDVKFDSEGNIIISGLTRSATSIATEGAFQEQIAGEPFLYEDEGLLAKFSPNGDLIWSTYYGGEGREVFNSLEVLETGKIIVSGIAQSDSLATPGSHKEDFFSGSGENVQDGIIACFSPEGERIWSTYFGGASYEVISAIKRVPNSEGLFIIAGETSSSEGISSGNPQFPDTLGGGIDAFYAKFDSEGNQLFGTYFGSETQPEYLFDIDISAEGEVLLVGSSWYESTSLATPGAHQSESYGGFDDGFIAMFNNENILEWATYLGGEESDNIRSCEFFSNGIVVGLQTSSLIPTAGMPLQSLIQVPFSTMLCKFSYTGEMLWSTYIDGSSGSQMRVTDLYSYNSSEFYLYANANSEYDYITENAFQPWNNGFGDMLIAKVTDETVVGLEDSPDFADISIYPNPGNGSFRIKAAQNFKLETLSVYDAAGRLVFSKSVEAGDVILQTGLNPGLYLVDIQTRSGNYQRKLIVQ